MPIVQAVKLSQPTKVIRKQTLSVEVPYLYGKASESYNLSLKILNLSDFLLIDNFVSNLTPIQFSTSLVQGAGIITKERWNAKAGQPFLDGEIDVQSGFIWLANQLNHASAESPQSLSLTDISSFHLSTSFVTVSTVSYPCESWTLEREVYGGNFTLVNANYDIFQPIIPSLNDWTFSIKVSDASSLNNLKSLVNNVVSFTDGITGINRNGIVYQVNTTEKAGIPNYWEVELKIYEQTGSFLPFPPSPEVGFSLNSLTWVANDCGSGFNGNPCTSTVPFTYDAGSCGWVGPNNGMATQYNFPSLSPGYNHLKLRLTINVIAYGCNNNAIRILIASTYNTSCGVGQVGGIKTYQDFQIPAGQTQTVEMDVTPYAGMTNVIAITTAPNNCNMGAGFRTWELQDAKLVETA